MVPKPDDAIARLDTKIENLGTKLGIAAADVLVMRSDLSMLTKSMQGDSRGTLPERTAVLESELKTHISCCAEDWKQVSDEIKRLDELINKLIWAMVGSMGVALLSTIGTIANLVISKMW